jgi:DNA-binding response OmpR family regulator
LDKPPHLKSKILVVEDSPEFQLLLRKSLAAAGYEYEIDCVGRADEAIEAIAKTLYDLIILDVSLPDGDGFRLCARFQSEDRTREIPVFFLTGRADVYDKVMAFSLGADDYIVKPFDPVELRARVDAKLSKRLKRASQGADWSAETINRGPLKLSIPLQRAYLAEGEAERDLKLTPAEFKILHYLIRNEGKPFSRNQILSAVWGDHIEVRDQNIYTHICALRRKLSSFSELIQSVPGLGYRFASELS